MLSGFVTVVLPVKNGIKYIKEAVDSILCQSYKNFELIIVDDGSVDGTYEYLCKINDDRLVLKKNIGVGLVSALNYGIDLARGEYIARMDADDISCKDRLLMQVKYLEGNPNCKLVTCRVEIIDEDGVILNLYESTNNLFYEKGAKFFCNYKAIIHPSVMFRASVARSGSGYRDYVYAEDRDFWMRVIGSDFFILPTILLKYRINYSGISRTKAAQQRASSIMSVVNYEIKYQYNIDIYLENKDLWSKLYSMSESESNKVEKYHAAHDFVRKEFRSNGMKCLIFCLGKLPYALIWHFRGRIINRKIVNHILSIYRGCVTRGGAS